jgi:uncharacterized protein
MPLAQDIITGRNSIQAYDAGQITINERVYTDSLVLSPNEIISPWPVDSLHALKTEHLDCVFNFKPDVVLLGTGEKQIFPQVELIGFFAEQGIGVEIMNNGALCRTFNILVAEDRQVVAAIIQSLE